MFCLPGTYSNDGIRCETCPLATYQYNPGQMNCFPCPDGFVTKQMGTESPNDCHDMRELALINDSFQNVLLKIPEHLDYRRYYTF